MRLTQYFQNGNSEIKHCQHILKCFSCKLHDVVELLCQNVQNKRGMHDKLLNCHIQISSHSRPRQKETNSKYLTDANKQINKH